MTSITIVLIRLRIYAIYKVNDDDAEYDDVDNANEDSRKAMLKAPVHMGTGDTASRGS